MQELSYAEILISGKNLILDAGAGSGKTTTLINTVTAIFLTDATVTPEEILLLTFTEKAAAEMRQRLSFFWQSLRAKLLAHPDRGIEDILGDFPGNISLSSEHAASRERLLSRLTGMNEQFGRLNASTLHSFCLTLLREHTVEAGCDPDFEVIDTFQRDRAFEDAFREFLEEEFERGPFDSRWHRFFDLFPDPEGGKKFLWEFLREMCLNTRDLFFLLEDRSLLKETDLGPYFSAFQIPYYRKLQEYLLAATPEEAEIASALESLARINDEMLTLLSRGTIPPRETIQSFTDTIAQIDGNRLRSVEHFPLNRENFTHRYFDGGELATETFRCTLPKLRERVSRCARILTRLQSGVVIGDLLMEKTAMMVDLFDKHKSGNLDFMDLLIKATALTAESKTVREGLKKRYRYLFIDEFQDTDPVQAYLCSFICEKQGALAASPADVELDRGKLFIVGDPRQSIYRFRRADPQMHFSMIDIITKSGGERISLPANYRSTPPLVAFFNIFFQEIFDRGSDYAFPYGQDLEPKRADAPLSPPAFYYSLSEEVMREEFIASLLLGIVQSGTMIEADGALRPASWRDIAILYTGDYGKRVLSPLGETLSEAGIPFLMPSLKGFYDRQEVKDLLFLIEALCDPANKTALYGALKSTIFGFTDTQLAGFFAHEAPPSQDLSEALAMIRKWTSLRDTMGVHDLLATVVHECGYAYSTLLFPEGERIFFSVEKLLLVAREFDHKYASSLRDFAGFLRQQIRISAEEGEIPYFEEGEDAVRIMSVHAAKGLEFPIVLFYLTGEFAGQNPGPILYDRVRNSFGFTAHNFATPSCYQMVEDTVVKSDAATTDVIPFIVLEKRKEAAETLRLSYVAMTRARDMLIVVSHPPGSGKMRKNSIASALDSFLGRYPSRESACPFTAIPGKLYPIEGNLTLFSSDVLNPVKAFSSPHTPWSPDIPDMREASLDAAQPIQSVAAVHITAEEEGFRFGDTFHRIMEFLPPFDGSLFESTHLLSRSFFEKEEERHRFLTIVEKMRGSFLMKQYRNWRVLGTEIPIASPGQGGVVRENADLVLMEGRNLLVLDYKTGERSREKDRQAEEQVSRYVSAIERATGMHVFGLVWFVEVDSWIHISGGHGKTE